MSISGKRGLSASAAAMSAAILLAGAGHAADLSAGPDSLKDAPDMAGDAHSGNSHATIPAGVTGAGMVGQGETMLMYMPMAMAMAGNYIGTDKVSTATILSTPNYMGGMMGAGSPKKLLRDPSKHGRANAHARGRIRRLGRTQYHGHGQLCG